MRALVLLLALAGCASSTVVLLPNEGGRPAGSLAVIDPKTGKDVWLVDGAGSRAVIAGRRTRVRTVAIDKAEKEYGALLGYLPEAPARFILYFPEGSTEIVSASVPARTALFEEVRRRGAGVDVQIEGHSDRVGNAADNDRLSAERAVVARDMLARLGLNAGITGVVGRGERAPVPGHQTADDVADPLNRRVEVVVR